ncbi:MAG TPA: DUF2911 domain-containing protein [Terriglobales bacterium]|nr:DUF2911 domain-containing protein [Terriglobales bacterium]
MYRNCTLSLLAITVSFCLVFPSRGAAEDSSTTACTFGSGDQVSVRYVSTPIPKKQNIPEGEPWTPGDKPLFLFTQAPLTIGDLNVPAGAFSLYTVKDVEKKKETWSLVVSRNVEQPESYDKSKDLGRVPIETGHLMSDSDEFRAYMGRLGPSTCTLRLDIGQTRAFVDIKDKR